MTPEQLTAWIQVAQLLAGVGVDIAQHIKGWFSSAHPELTPEQQDAAYQAIMDDDNVRIAIATAASQPDSPSV